jgi:hypothetical protein
MLTPEDLWKKLALEAGEDAITDAASVPVTQAERDLHEAGFDVKAERERANARIGELAGESAAASDGTEPTVRLPSGPAPEPPGPKIAPVVPIGLWRTAGLLAAACVALFVLIKLTQGPDVVGYHHPSDREKAEDDRSAAEESCARKDWAACKASLDEAATLDPAGESEPRVQQARDEIASATAGQRVEGGAGGPGR